MDELIRVGGNSDGGHVLPGALLRDADALISMGLGHNWQFEKDARVLAPAIRVHAYDHVVSEKIFKAIGSRSRNDLDGSLGTTTTWETHCG
ncbi:MAG: hypothetical protein E4H00_09085 [Myxococcales bacterium]|nr:MAG: hypothetical protein E4H00_09085 [Myxococcales bacterium]